MRRLAAAGLLIAIASSTGSFASQSPAQFAGAWQLTTSDASPETAAILVVSGSATSQRIQVERRSTSRAELAHYGTDSNRPSFVHEAKWLGATLILTMSSGHEAWSIGADGILRIITTAGPPGATPTTTHLAYRRLSPALRPGENLLDNPAANRAGGWWVSFGHAHVEACDGNPCFVVRDPGGFRQTVLLPGDAAGHFVVMVGSGKSERINPDGAITGLPYLHGTAATPDGGRFLGTFQGMLARPRTPQDWVTMSGVFRIPPGTARVIFMLGQAEAKDVPQNGSAARFDDLGFYLFPAESAARAFVRSWSGRR